MVHPPFFTVGQKILKSPEQKNSWNQFQRFFFSIFSKKFFQNWAQFSVCLQHLLLEGGNEYYQLERLQRRKVWLLNGAFFIWLVSCQSVGSVGIEKKITKNWFHGGVCWMSKPIITRIWGLKAEKRGFYGKGDVARQRIVGIFWQMMISSLFSVIHT